MIFTCGKLAHVWDSRTVQFANFMNQSEAIPSKYDFDKGRAEIPLSPWGSDLNKCDVIASQANQLLRLGRVEQRRTIKLNDRDVIGRYRRLAGVKKVGDENDKGLAALAAMKAWRKGWQIGGKDYTIALYGEIDPREHDLLRRVIYFFKGVHIGFWLPAIVDGATLWDFRGAEGELWKPGSLGGVLAYCKAYNEHGYQIFLQGQKIVVSNDFVDHYSDEAWVCIESFSYWETEALDMEKLTVVRPELAQYTEEGEE